MLLVGACVLAGLVLTPGTGRADDGLASSSPTDGAILTTAPDAVVLTFSTPPDPAQSHASARDVSGARADTGQLDRYGRTGLRLPVAIRATGDYTVAWHVAFEDGNEVVGVLTFSVGTGVPPPHLSAAAARRATDALSSGHDHSVDPLSATVLVADLVVLVAVVVLLLRRPRPRLDAATTE